MKALSDAVGKAFPSFWHVHSCVSPSQAEAALGLRRQQGSEEGEDPAGSGQPDGEIWSPGGQPRSYCTLTSPEVLWPTPTVGLFICRMVGLKESSGSGSSWGSISPSVFCGTAIPQGVNRPWVCESMSETGLSMLLVRIFSEF